MVPILDHGSLELLDWMPRENLDKAIVDAARVSYGDGTKTPSEDRSLIRYLMRHHHTSPFEMVEFKWRVKAPLFVARQWVRHRTASWNEVSARYSDMSNEEFYAPSTYRRQAVSNKQGSDGVVDADYGTLDDGRRVALQRAMESYVGQRGAGVAREVARTVLPVSMYTEWIWKCDLHNTFGFLQQRLHHHAQYEIRVYAEAMFGILKTLCPIAVEAFEDFRLNAITLTRLEVEALRNSSVNNVDLLDGRATKREQDEWLSKRKDLFVRPNQPSVH